VGLKGAYVPVVTVQADKDLQQCAELPYCRYEETVKLLGDRTAR
jgi:hypothetical protein